MEPVNIGYSFLIILSQNKAKKIRSLKGILAARDLNSKITIVRMIKKTKIKIKKILMMWKIKPDSYHKLIQIIILISR